MGLARWLPETMAEAKKRVMQCKKENNCDFCDAEIHEIIINRHIKTKKQSLR